MEDRHQRLARVMGLTDLEFSTRANSEPAPAALAPLPTAVDLVSQGESARRPDWNLAFEQRTLYRVPPPRRINRRDAVQMSLFRKVDEARRYLGRHLSSPARSHHPATGDSWARTRSQKTEAQRAIESQSV